MPYQTKVGAPDPTTLLQEMQGQTITQGWDVVSAMSVDQVNNLLSQQYITKLAIGKDLPPINGTVPIIENISAQFVNVVLGSPLIQFSPSLDPQEATLTLNFISGTVNTVQVQDGISTILTSQTILPGNNYELTGVVPLASVQGEVENQHNVVIDITKAGSFTAKLGFPSGAAGVLGEYFLTLLQSNASTFSYVLGTLEYDPSGTGLIPVMFDFATQIDNKDLTDGGRLLLLIATTYNPGGGSQTALTLANVVPSTYSTTLIVSSQVLFQDILLSAFENKLSSASPTITATPSNPHNPESNYVLEITAGVLNLAPVSYEIGGTSQWYYSGTASSDRSSYTAGNVTVPINPLQIAPSGNTIVISGNTTWNQNWVVGQREGLLYLYTGYTGPMSASISCVCSASVNTDSQLLEQEISFSSQATVAVNFVGESGWNWFMDGGAQDAISGEAQSEAQSQLTSFFSFTLPSVSTFAVSNLLFPCQNAGQSLLDFQEAYVPGDLVIFGQIRSNSIETIPLQMTLAGGQEQQFRTQQVELTSGSSAVTWSITPQVGSITATGLYTAPATITQSQTILVTATTTQGNSVAQSAITLVPSGVLISPAVVIVPSGVNTPQQFAAVVADADQQAVTWSVSAGGGSITEDGSYTPSTNSSSAPVAVTVTASNQANPSEQGTATVVLMDSGTAVGGVGLSPQVISLGPSQTQSFTAENASKKPFPTVQWSLFPNVGSISAEGVYTAPSTIESPQTVVIVASVLSEFGTFAGIAIVNLLP